MCWIGAEKTPQNRYDRLFRISLTSFERHSVKDVVVLPVVCNSKFLIFWHPTFCFNDDAVGIVRLRNANDESVPNSFSDLLIA